MNLNVCSPANLDALYVRHRVEGMDGMPQLGLSPHSTAVQGVVLNHKQFAPPPFPCPNQAQSFTSRKVILEIKTLYVQ